MNEKTTVTFQMGKEELQTGVLALLQYVTITPPRTNLSMKLLITTLD